MIQPHEQNATLSVFYSIQPSVVVGSVSSLAFAIRQARIVGTGTIINSRDPVSTSSAAYTPSAILLLPDPPIPSVTRHPIPGHPQRFAWSTHPASALSIKGTWPTFSSPSVLFMSVLPELYSMALSNTGGGANMSSRRQAALSRSGPTKCKVNVRM